MTQTSLWRDSDRWEPGPEVAAGSDPGVESWILKREPGSRERELGAGAETGSREPGARSGNGLQVRRKQTGPVADYFTNTVSTSLRLFHPPTGARRVAELLRTASRRLLGH